MVLPGMGPMVYAWPPSNPVALTTNCVINGPMSLGRIER
jgi:hypothetical protein